MKASLTLLFALALCHTACGEIKSETARVPIRDGVNVYRDDAAERAPFVLIRTSYDRTKQKATAERWLPEAK